MIANKRLLVIALGACLLGLSAPGSQKNPVERPLKGYGYATGVFTLDETGAFIAYEAVGGGNLTHLGRISVHMVGEANEAGVMELLGTVTAANGDELRYALSGPGGPADIVDIVFIGGTGRFEHATGTATQDIDAVWTPGPAENQLTVEMTVYTEGTLIY